MEEKAKGCPRCGKPMTKLPADLKSPVWFIRLDRFKCYDCSIVQPIVRGKVGIVA